MDGAEKKKTALKELWSGKIKKAALEEAFSLRVPLFPPFFSSSIIGKRKFDKIFINTRLSADNKNKKDIDLSFVGCGYSPEVKLNNL